MNWNPLSICTVVILLSVFVLIGCQEDNPTEPNTVDYQIVFGFWDSQNYGNEDYPFHNISFSNNKIGMIGTLDGFSYFEWDLTDTSLDLNLFDGSRSYNYDVLDDTLKIWLGLSDIFLYHHIFQADTVYVEQNPDLMGLALPMASEVEVVLHGVDGMRLEIYADGMFNAGMHTIIIDYPININGNIYALDILVPEELYVRNYKTIIHREDASADARYFITNYYDRQLYLEIEYIYAVDNTMSSSSFLGAFNEWVNLEFEEKLDYLPWNFRHDLHDDDEEAYYWCVGVYVEQFGYGWPDQVNDDPLSSEWDGTSAKLTEYRQLLGLE